MSYSNLSTLESSAQKELFFRFSLISKVQHFFSVFLLNIVLILPNFSHADEPLRDEFEDAQESFRQAITPSLNNTSENELTVDDAMLCITGGTIFGGLSYGIAHMIGVPFVGETVLGLTGFAIGFLTVQSYVSPETVWTDPKEDQKKD